MICFVLYKLDDRTLRVNGPVEISTDPDLLELVALDGKLPVSVLKVTVEEAFLHCAKALIRARLWEPYAHPRITPPGRGP